MIPRTLPPPLSDPGHQPGSEEVDTLVARARALAAGLKQYVQSAHGSGWQNETRYLLQEAQNRERPLAERIRILGLMAACADDFFILRLPHIQEAAAKGDGRAAEQLQRLPAQWTLLFNEASACLTQDIVPELARLRVNLSPVQDLLFEERTWVRNYFQQRVYPLLTPLAVDPGRPFPFISSTSINLLVQLPEHVRSNQWRQPTYARVKVPRVLPRFVELPGLGDGRTCVWSEDLVQFSVTELFQAMQVKASHLFRVLRAGGYRQSLLMDIPGPDSLHAPGPMTPVVRLDVEASMPDSMLTWLVEHLQVPSYSIYRSEGPLGPVQLVDLANLIAGFRVVP